MGMSMEYMLYPLFFSMMKNLTGNTILDTILILSIMIIMNSSVNKNILEFINDWWKNDYKLYNKVTLTTEEDLISKRFKALMYFLSKKPHPSIRHVREII